MKIFSVLATLAAALTILACSSEGKLGEECDESGVTEGECESGGVCGTDTGGAQVCLKICTEQADCDGDQECNGVEGSNVKGCRTKSGSNGGKK